MGNTAVAVLHYDHSQEISRALPRAASAMRDMPGSVRPQEFGCGAVISWGHADSYQVVVVHGNTGWRVGMWDAPPPDDVMAACADALRRHGWRVEKPKT